MTFTEQSKRARCARAFLQSGMSYIDEYLRDERRAKLAAGRSLDLVPKVVQRAHRHLTYLDCRPSAIRHPHAETPALGSRITRIGAALRDRRAILQVILVVMALGRHHRLSRRGCVSVPTIIKTGVHERALRLTDTPFGST
eukprot:4770952-Prymnesium_polylepis.5